MQSLPDSAHLRVNEPYRLVKRYGFTAIPVLQSGKTAAVHGVWNMF
ncbi:MAG: hypothetical protein HY348_10035 [Nitrospira defluvii]|nr:hypothetical protein [Nitrospira defluvii]